ncbi:MAG: hypothetical protein HQL18_01180 [Candidatus Omnitrophica bacterium]|nr:hypothetical protein [Candidatus Omnitrophota bacterium]
MRSILTVTLNPALDKIVHPDKTLVVPGGKGVNVSRALKALEVDSESLVAVAGRNGRALVKAMKAEGLVPLVFEVSGETRVNLTQAGGEGEDASRKIEPGPEWTEAQLKRFLKSFPAIVKGRALVVFSGSLPPGIPNKTYHDLIRLAHKEGVATVLDARGPALRFGIKAKPFAVKPNREEAEEFLKSKIVSREDIKKALQSFLDCGMKMVLLTLGIEGLAAADGAECWLVRTQKFRGHAVGAGDAALAGALVAMMKARPFVDQVRLAAVCGGANVLGQVPGGISQETLARSAVGISLERL